MGKCNDTADRLPSQEELNAMLRYDAENGALVWKARGVSQSWDTRWAGKPALAADSGHGYKQGRINGVLHYAHRVIWKMLNGPLADLHIDHINGDRSDNRIHNIRAVTRAQNQRNLSKMAHNTSGHVGVHWDARDCKWVAQIKLSGVPKFLGRFELIEDAIRVRKQAERANDFHVNHGRAVNQGAI